MNPKRYSGLLAVAAFLCLLLSQDLNAQNNYPASGDARIHSLTIGTGPGTGATNTALGDSALFSNTQGYGNAAVGYMAMLLTTTGYNNTALGYEPLYHTTTGTGNVAIGPWSLYSNQGGGSNIAIGWDALYNNTSGVANTAVGIYAGYGNTTGNYNTSSGFFSMDDNTTGSNNTAYGKYSMMSNGTGSNNTVIGASADVNASNLNNATAIGYQATAFASNSVRIGNSSVTSIGGYAPWTNFSDGRYKRNIAQNVPGLAFINRLAPVTYTMDVSGIEARLQGKRKTVKGPDGRQLAEALADPVYQQAMKEKSQVRYTGFVAQDVEKAAQSIGYDFSGVDRPKDDQSFYGLRYSDFVVPLVKAVQELSQQNDSLRNMVDSLVAVNARLDSRMAEVEQLLGIGSNRKSSNLSVSSARLFQNSPNPFSENTLINYYIPANAGQAALQIVNMNGETVKTVAVNGAGYGQLNLQTGQLAAGTYTYSLFVDGKLVESKRMVLVR